MASRPNSSRQSSLDEAAIQTLEKRLLERPQRSELEERNILKPQGGLSARLVAVREKLERSRLEDTLDQALQKRPKAEDLVKEEGEVPPQN